MTIQILSLFMHWDLWNYVLREMFPEVLKGIAVVHKTTVFQYRSLWNDTNMGLWLCDYMLCRVRQMLHHDYKSLLKSMFLGLENYSCNIYLIHLNAENFSTLIANARSYYYWLIFVNDGLSFWPWLSAVENWAIESKSPPVGCSWQTTKQTCCVCRHQERRFV